VQIFFSENNFLWHNDDVGYVIMWQIILNCTLPKMSFVCFVFGKKCLFKTKALWFVYYKLYHDSIVIYDSVNSYKYILGI
jgi:hypothetical protein